MGILSGVGHGKRIPAARRPYVGLLTPSILRAPGQARRLRGCSAPMSVKTRRFGRLGWQVSEIGAGMWGMVAWSGADDAEVGRSLQRAVDLGCTFFDTAFAYGDGRSERLLG